MSWDLTGKRVVADYNGTPIKGIVESSRVGYGAQIKHYVLLDVPFAFEEEGVTRLAVKDENILSAI